MDPLTHGVLGAALGWAAGGRRLGALAPVATGGAAMLPDLDLLLRPISDPALPWELHRHFSHALVFAPVGALIAAAPFLLRQRAGGRGLLYLVCLLGYLSHSLLDNATSWGTLWYWPFSPARVALDWIAIVDPVFSAALFAGLVAGLWRRRAAPAVAGLLIAGLYMGIGAVQRGRAETALRASAAARGIGVERLRIVPTLANVVLWRGLYTAGGRIHAAAIWTPFTRPARVEPGASLPLILAAPGRAQERAGIVAAAAPRSVRVDDALARFLTLADGYAALVPDRPDIVGDMRYSLEPGGFEPLWGLRIEATSDARSDPVAWVDLLETGPSFSQRLLRVIRRLRQ